MVGHNAVRYVFIAIRIGVRNIGRCLDQCPHHINVVIVVLALQYCGNPFKAHARINGWAWQ